MKIERFLAALSKIYAQDGKRQLQEIIVNAQKSLSSLKEYFSDTKKMYGYEIEMTQLQDTTFLFLSDVVPNAKRREGMKNISYVSIICE